jgi:rubrerythrin
MRAFESLTPREVLALAIHVERANTRRFQAFADVFRGYDGAVASRFEELAREEAEHEAILTRRFRQRFGDEIPAVEEAEVAGVIESADLDDAEHLIFGSLDPTRVYELALRAEQGARAFYQRAVAVAPDGSLADLYRELADAEEGHEAWIKERLESGRATGGRT